MKNKNSKLSYKAILSEKQYLKIISANLINRFGDSIDAVAFGWLVYSLTGSASWLAIILGVNVIPTILFQPFAGALISYLDKKKVMILTDIGRGVLVLLIAILLIINVLNPWIIMLITFCNSSLEALRVPCGTSLVPKLLKKENYTFGMSLNQGASRISELLGMGLAGVIIAVFGVAGAIIIDAVTFILSAFILMFLKIPKEDAEKISHNYLTELKEGISYFKKNKILGGVTMLCFLLSFTAIPWDNLKAAFISESLHLDAIALSVGGVFMTIGLTLGTFIFPYITKWFSKKTIFIGGGVFIGLLYFGLIASTLPTDTLLRLCSYGIFSFLFGLTNSMISMALVVTFMSNVEDSYVGRTSSIFNAVAMSSIPLGSFLVGAIASWFSINQIYIVTGIVTILLFGLALLFKSVRQIKDDR